MTANSFVDSNILIYSAVPHPGEDEKTRVADEILDQQPIGLSIQVLQEFYVQAIRKSRQNKISHEEALSFIGAWKRFPIQPLTQVILERALVGCDRWQISYWDATILEAARELGCREVLSEDLSEGKDYDGIRVINPFV